MTSDKRCEDCPLRPVPGVKPLDNRCEDCLMGKPKPVERNGGWDWAKYRNVNGFGEVR